MNCIKFAGTWSYLQTYSRKINSTLVLVRFLSEENMTSSCKSYVEPRFNHLRFEKSSYLLQHATNPVDWYPWCDQALQRAKKEEKLIFLSVGYSTCHWCHVMERESFEDESTARILNEHFINVKVDREERPDIDKTYMTFIQLSTGSGGWPMNVFLTPDLKPIGGGTYFAPEEVNGRRSFKSILLDMAKKWETLRETLRAQGDAIVGRLQTVSAFDVRNAIQLSQGALPDPECVDLAFRQLSRDFDEKYGGFGVEPKFPQPSNFNFLFHKYSQDPQHASSRPALNMAVHTLDRIRKGGIHDHVGQGFARYSTDEKWHVPHFEKMLYDQAQLAVAYANGYLITKKLSFANTVIDILTYVSRDLSHTEGGFFSAEDADSFPTVEAVNKQEGAFYTWKYEEIERLLSRSLEKQENISLCDVFCHHYNIKKNGNVDPSMDPHGELLDQNVLIILGSETETAANFGISIDTLTHELKIAQSILFKERCKRPRPHLDSKIITSWNGLMISGYAKAAQVLQNEKYEKKATKAADFVKNYLWVEQENRLLRCCYADKNIDQILQVDKPIYGVLNDYAFLIRGLLDLYECTFDETLIEWCEQLQDAQNTIFWEEHSSLYESASRNDHFVLFPQVDDQDTSEPCGNSVSVHNLLRLSAIIDRKDYYQKARQVLVAFSGRLSRLPIALPEMTSNLMMFRDTITHIYVVENENDEMAKKMLNVIYKHYIPNKIVVYVRNTKDSILYRKSKTVCNYVDAGMKKAVVHMCKNQSCSLPLDSIEALNENLNNISIQSSRMFTDDESHL